jgi:hypothetical protein
LDYVRTLSAKQLYYTLESLDRCDNGDAMIPQGRKEAIVEAITENAPGLGGENVAR